MGKPGGWDRIPVSRKVEMIADKVFAEEEAPAPKVEPEPKDKPKLKKG